MKKTKILFPIFLVIILMFSFLFTPSVNATVSYYNHIQNPSFLSYSNYIEDGGFESGLENQGLIYGNWSSPTFNAIFSTEHEYSGVYGLFFDDSNNNDTMWYNMTESVLGADIVSFSFYGMWIQNEGFEVHFHYSDSSFDTYDTTVEDTVDGSSYHLKSDGINTIDDAKYLVAIKFDGDTTGGDDYAIDDVVMLVDDGGGQDDITDSSIPWFHGTTPPLISPHIYGYIGINSTFGRLDNSSGYIGHLDSRGTIQQNVDLLDTDYMHFFDLYYYVDICNDIKIKINIVYSDGSYDVKTEALTVNATWTYLNYGISFIDSDKYITKITIGLTSYTSEIVYLDDIGLWASVPITYRRFKYEISPYPIIKTTSFFNVYMGIQYTMYCYLYNATGALAESGNYTITDLTGVTSDSFINGTFSYILTARNYKVDFQEYISISIVTEDEVLVFQILAIWNYVPVDVDIPITPTETSNFMFLFIFIVVPSMFLAVILKPVGIPIIGFLSGLTIMTSIGRMVGIIDLWFLFVMVLVCVLLILAMLKRGLYT